VWLHYEGGVRAWIAKLAVSDPAILEEQIVQLPPILRNDQQVEAWKEAVIEDEKEIRFNRDWVGKDSPSGDWYLDRHFPMSTSAGNCLWPGKCAYFAVCHENADPHDESLFRARRVNHPQEELCQLSKSI